MAEEQWKKIPKAINGELHWKNGRRSQVIYAEVIDDKFVLHPKNHRGTMHVIQQIPFHQMAEIVEIPKRSNQPGCFKILLKNCNEEVFKCTDKGTQGMQKWVENLRHAKQFWKDKEIANKTIINRKITLDREDEASRSLDATKPRVFFTLWDREIVGLLVDDKSTFTDMYPKIFSSACPRGACSTCRLRHQTSKLWAVDTSGSKRLVDKQEILIDLCHIGNMLYVLEHRQKLLIVHFSDHSYEVLPAPGAITAEEVLELAPIATKLEHLGCIDPGLFLRMESGSAELLFQRNERPFRYEHGLFIARSRAKRANSKKKSKEEAIAELRKTTFLAYCRRKKTNAVTKGNLADQIEKSTNDNNGLTFHFDHFALEKTAKSVDVPSPRPRSRRMVVKRRPELCGKTEHGSENGHDVSPDGPPSNTRIPNVPVGPEPPSLINVLQSFDRSEKNMPTQPSICNPPVNKCAQVCEDKATLQNKTGKHVSELPAQLVQVPVDHYSEVPIDHNSEVPADHNSEVPVDHNSEFLVDHNLEVPVDHNSEVPVDHNSEFLVDHNLEVPADHNLEVPVDHNSEFLVDHNLEVGVVHNLEITLSDTREHKEHEEHGTHEVHMDIEDIGNTESISAAEEVSSVEQDSGKETSSTGSVQNMSIHTESKPGNPGISTPVDIPAISEKIVEKFSAGSLQGNLDSSNASPLKHSVSEPVAFSNERRLQKRKVSSCQFSAAKFRSVSEPDLHYACANDALISGCVAKSVDEIDADSDVDVVDVFCAEDSSDYSDEDLDFKICAEKAATIYENQARSAGPCWKLAKRVETAVEKILSQKEDSEKVNELLESELSPALLELFEFGRKKSRTFLSSIFKKAVDIWKIIRTVSAGDSTARRIISKVEQRTELCFLRTKFLQLIRACVQAKYLGQWFELVHREDVREKISGFYESDALLLQMARSPAMEHLKLYLDKLNVLVLKEVRPLNTIAPGLVSFE